MTSRGQICIVTSHAYPESVGGEETFVRQYSRFLNTTGIAFTVLSSSSGSGNERLSPVYFRPFSVPFLGFEVYSLIWACLAFLRIVKLHSSQRICVIHSVETGYGGLASAFAVGLLRVKLVVHSHTMRSLGLRNIRGSTGDLRTWPYWALERCIDKFVVSRASKTIAVSEEVASFVSSLGVPRSHIVVVPSALDVESYFPHGTTALRDRLGIGKDIFVIGYLGRLAPMKGVEILLRAFMDFMEKSPEKVLVLVAGDGPLRQELEAMVRENHLRGVKFLGSYSDVSSFFESIDVFVFPSFFEGSPIALLEAMAAGCAIIASDIQSVREIAGDSILMFPPGNFRKLSQMLLELRGNPTLRSNLTAASRKNSLSFTTAKAMPRILEVDMDP